MVPAASAERPTAADDITAASRAWVRMCRKLSRIMGLRRLWAFLGMHLRQFTQLRDKSKKK